MATLKAFSNTTIGLAKTHGDLEDMLEKRGIRASQWSHFTAEGDEPGLVVLEFQYQRTPQEAPLGFRVAVGYKPEIGPAGGKRGTSREQAGRALYWHVKNLFDAIDFGIVDLEQAFMPYLVLPSGETAYERSEPLLAALSSGRVPALLARPEGPR